MAFDPPLANSRTSFGRVTWAESKPHNARRRNKRDFGCVAGSSSSEIRNPKSDILLFLSYKLELDPARRQACLESHIEKLLRGDGNDVAAIHGVMVHVHPDEFFRHAVVHIAGKLHRVGQ